MFTQYFGLQFNPFSKEIDCKYLFKGKEYTELSSRFKYLESARGIGMITGEPGTGKTTMLRSYTKNLNPSLFKPIYFALSTVTVKEFYIGLAAAFGEIPKFQKVSLFHQIQSSITRLYNQEKITPVIILDESHLASNGILEDLRLIFNFSMDSENPFIMILSGETLLQNKLTLNANNPLRQRIVVKYCLQGLAEDEIESYCTSRLSAAGCSEPVFTKEAITAIFGLTKGAPRLINNLATAALICACAKQTHSINEEIIYQAQGEVGY